ncbi:GTP-dependent dephospho-CoA kinase family protein [Natronolimnohabitans sp. A-GB9]|uniref:GTP-dependent dephospho-CoA kinase family protein n=1 Tax=Natronolimnohabitans sp. A-GB9 TaxID=3069757 RepID=UPI0027B7E879|nr:GTP-dependent dephospho-CoA kinase family protein [Natronolimnohabitans sp. A-GB9]MDQ2051078.1 GTP-dependent dephospho-CoA kinase family protein [Natronolimnohabitans sp. A-GB9]
MSRDDPPADPADADADVDEQLLVLPDDLRHELKEPMGPIETEAERLLEDVDGPLIAVGDVVTYHFLEAGRPPDVALVDERTKRQAVDEEIRETVTEETTLEAVNPPAVISEDVIEALLEGLERDDPTTILVEGEEDLVALPAIVAAPEKASVVYGQPDEGMVHVSVTDDTRAEARALLDRFEGDTDRFWAVLETA